MKGYNEFEMNHRKLKLERDEVNQGQKPQSPLIKHSTKLKIFELIELHQKIEEPKNINTQTARISHNCCACKI